MQGGTPKKTPGKLNLPVLQAEFDRLPLASCCRSRHGVFYRLHSTDPKTGRAYHPIYFSQAGRSRFDHPASPGTVCIGDSLAGVLMEIFDDHWGPVGSIERSISHSELQTYWVTLVAIPTVKLFYAHKGNLSKIGTDAQLIAGDHAIAREWALRLASHPIHIGGIRYPSRHDTGRQNIALIQRAELLPYELDLSLTGAAKVHASNFAQARGHIIYGPEILLANHPELNTSLKELQVARLP